MRNTAKMLIAGAAAVASVVALSGSASAGAPADLYKGQSLNIGDSIYASNGSTEYKLIMQSDGNLVEYGYSGANTVVCWASGTNGTGATHATYQQDGNFVVYTAGGTAVWASDTQGVGGSYVNLNSAGELWVGYWQLTNPC